MAIFTIRSKKAKKIKVENSCLIILLFYGQLIQEKCIILNIFTIYSTKTYLLLNVLYPQNTPHQSTTILDHFKEKKKHLYFSTTQKAKLFILSSGKKFVLSMKKILQKNNNYYPASKKSKVIVFNV